MNVFTFIACLFMRHRWRVYDQADQALPPITVPPTLGWGCSHGRKAYAGPSIRVVCQRCGARAMARYECEDASDAWRKGQPAPTWRLVAPWGRDVDGALSHAEVEARLWGRGEGEG